MSGPMVLRGTTWAHSRGYVPLVACCEAWSEFHAGIEVRWAKRSFQAFGEGSPEQLAREYDLVVFDYPLTGGLAATGLFVPLDEALPAGYLEQLSKCSVGPSYSSYSHAGRQWGLPLDAACHVAVWRSDLLSVLGVAVPQSWPDVLELARSTRKVFAPFYPQAAWGTFLSLCAAAGEPACRNGRFVDGCGGRVGVGTTAAPGRSLRCGGAGVEPGPRPDPHDGHRRDRLHALHLRLQQLQPRRVCAASG